MATIVTINARTAKSAELASGLGAIVLGAGLALVAPDILRTYAIPMLVVGIVVHGLGMTLQYRFERVERAPLWWESALFWTCWVSLGGLSAWLVARFAAS